MPINRISIVPKSASKSTKTYSIEALSSVFDSQGISYKRVGRELEADIDFSGHYSYKINPEKGVFLSTGGETGTVYGLLRSLKADTSSIPATQVDRSEEDLKTERELIDIIKDSKPFSEINEASLSAIGKYFHGRGLPLILPDTARVSVTPQGYDLILPLVGANRATIPSVHVTLISKSGEKRPQAWLEGKHRYTKGFLKTGLGNMTFTKIDGDAEQLVVGEVSGWIGIGEGLESVLSGRLLTGWSSIFAISDSGIKTFFENPENLYFFQRSHVGIAIFVDRDISEAGQKASAYLAQRAKEVGIPVLFLVPPFIIKGGKKGADWNDAIKELKEDGAKAALILAISRSEEELLKYLNDHDVEPFNPTFPDFPETDFILKAPAGSGKTEKVIKYLTDQSKNDQNYKAEYFAPTKNLGAEITARINSIRSGTAKLIEGRNENNCSRCKVAETYGQKGLPVFSHLCRQETEDKNNPIECENYKKCLYIKQFENDGEQIRVMAHSYLQTERTRLDWLSGTIADSIIDEQCQKEFISHRPIELGQLAAGDGNPTVDLIKKAMFHAVPGKKSILESVKNLGIDKENWTSAMKELGDRTNRFLTGITPGASDRVHIEALAAIPKNDPSYRLLKILQEDLTAVKEDSDRISFKKTSGEITGIVLHYLVKSKRIAGRIIRLDADASVEIEKRLFGKTFDLIETNFRRNLKVTQIADRSFSKVSLFTLEAKKEDGAARKLRLNKAGFTVFEAIKDIIDDPESLIVTYKELADLLKESNPAAGIEHFGNLRGINKYKKHKRVAVIGRNQPSPSDLEDLGRAIFGADTEPISYLPEPEPGKNPELTTHPDKRVQEILYILRECETLQAISRLRDIHSKSKKEVILLSNLALPINAEKIRWQDFLRAMGIESQRSDATGMKKMREIFATTGVLPLASDPLFRIGNGAFKNTNSARLVLQRANITQAHLDYNNKYSVYEPVLNHCDKKIRIYRLRARRPSEQWSTGSRFFDVLSVWSFEKTILLLGEKTGLIFEGDDVAEVEIVDQAVPVIRFYEAHYNDSSIINKIEDLLIGSIPEKTPPIPCDEL